MGSSHSTPSEWSQMDHLKSPARLKNRIPFLSSPVFAAVSKPSLTSNSHVCLDAWISDLSDLRGRCPPRKRLTEVKRVAPPVQRVRPSHPEVRPSFLALCLPWPSASEASPAAQSSLPRSRRGADAATGRSELSADTIRLTPVNPSSWEMVLALLASVKGTDGR